MEITRTTSFWRDLQAILDYFCNLQAEETVLRFLDSLDETISFIEEFPHLGNPWESSRPNQQGIRFRLVKTFENYVLFYRCHEDHLHLLRVVYGSQNMEQI